MFEDNEISDQSEPTEEIVPSESEVKPDEPEVDKSLEDLSTDVKQTDEYKELLDKYLRLAAEFDNFRKRSAREYARIIETAEDGLILELLQVVDDLDRARGHDADDLDSFKQGTEMIYNKFDEILKKRGLREIKAVGEVFDPTYHEAVMQLEVEDKDDGIIIEEVQKGYFLNSKVLRPAKVVVAKRKIKE
jgi:molecular chaperone GrpE